MKFAAKLTVCLLLAAMPCLPGCVKKSKPPTMSQFASPPPGADASAEEVERYQLEQEKRSLSEKYGDNIDRIKQINDRLIELNIKINLQTNHHY